MTLQFFWQTKLKQSVVSFHLHSHRTSNQLDPLLKLLSSPSVPSLRRKYPTSPLQPSYNMSSRPNPLAPSPSNLSHTLTSTHIINTSLLTGIFPTTFKQARVTPLLKKPTLNTSLIENYRPVSLLPFIAKTLERVVFNQVSLFLSQNNKLDAKQSGFRSGHSTETELLSVTEALRIAKADFKSSVLILLDLSAAFDTVNHQILLSTLSSLDITGIPLLVWILSHWSVFQGGLGRGGVSKAHQLVTGVPQGSVLGPLLFSTYGFSYHFSTLMTHSSISHFDQMIQQ